MKHIIENANVVSDQGIIVCSFLIEKNIISHFGYGKSLQKYKCMRMNVSSFIMAPGNVIADFNLPSVNNLIEYKNHIKELIRKGCTTVLIPCYIPYESEFEKKIREARHSMVNSSIDFVVGIHLPLEKMTPSTIRLCKRYKLPFIIVDIYEQTDISAVPWGWIKEAQFQYQVPIYPIWKTDNPKKAMEQMELWDEVTSNHQIPTHFRFPMNQSPLSKVIRMQIGIYPKKGDFLIGNDIDYNLYLSSEEQMQVEEIDKLNYDKVNPAITVHKGRLLKIKDVTNYFPGFGEELKVKAPGLFASIDQYHYFTNIR